MYVYFCLKYYSMKLFVAGFPNDFDDVDIKEMFELYGTVASAKLITDRATGKSKGFGFVEMPDKTEAMQTIETLNGVSIKGKKISVQQAEERGSGGSGSSSGGGNFRGRDSRDNNRDSRDNYNRRY